MPVNGGKLSLVNTCNGVLPSTRKNKLDFQTATQMDPKTVLGGKKKLNEMFHTILLWNLKTHSFTGNMIYLSKMYISLNTYFIKTKDSMKNKEVCVCVYIYIWLGHFVVQQKLKEHYKIKYTLIKTKKKIKKCVFFFIKKKASHTL